jgi:hypothetical protein
MWVACALAAGHSAWCAPLPEGTPFWCRPLIFWLHIMQPVVRSWSRYGCHLRHTRLPQVDLAAEEFRVEPRSVSFNVRDFYWASREGRGREILLEHFVQEAQRSGWCGDFHIAWQPHDAKLFGDLFHNFRLCTATEELGQRRRFTRVRCELRLTWAARLALCLVAVVAAAGAVRSQPIFAVLDGALLGTWTALLVRSRARCWRAIARLIWRAAELSGLQPFDQASGGSTERRARDHSESLLTMETCNLSPAP